MLQNLGIYMDIYVINVNCAENIDKNLLMSFQKRKFSNEEKQRIHSFSYLMLDRILKEVYKTEDRELVFEGKKPYLKSHDKYFSISHSGDYVVIAFSDCECGIDIEQIKQRDYQAISRRMNFYSEDLEDFYYNWTSYESKYKLGTDGVKCKSFRYEDYIITALSVNNKESFELYIQNEKAFPNLKI